MILDFIKQTMRGKSIYRVLFNNLIREHCSNLSGRVLDVAAGREASYNQYLSSVEIEKGDQIGTKRFLDFNKPFPFKDETFEAVMFFNAIYIADDPLFTLKEIKRVLKNNGQLFLASPFIANEMPEPHDYERLTKEGLKRLLKKSGFKNFTIERFGERFTAGAYLLHPLLFFNTLRLLVNGISLILDKVIPKIIKTKYPVPLGYFGKAIK